MWHRSLFILFCVFMDMWSSFCYFNTSVLLVLLAFHLVQFHHSHVYFGITSFTTALGQNYSCVAYKMEKITEVPESRCWDERLSSGWQCDLIADSTIFLGCCVLPECLGFLSSDTTLTERPGSFLSCESCRLVRGKADGMSWSVFRPEKEMPATLVTGRFLQACV